MKLATTIAEMNAFTSSPAASVREYADTGFRYLDYSFYSVVRRENHPFMGDNDNETLANVTSATWDFDDEAFDEISDDAKDFISNLLKKDMK